jgi:hypothetical protein
MSDLPMTSTQKSARIAELEAEIEDRSEMVDRFFNYGGEQKCIAKLEAERDAASQDYTDLLKDFRALREDTQTLIDGMKPSYTTAKNSSAVRKGFEVSGSIRHYECQPHQIHKLMNVLEAGDE